jgi:hypothetical protein
MSVHVVLQGEGGTGFDDADLPSGWYGSYENGESRIEQVSGPTAWHSVTGDVWRKGMLLR